MSNLDLYNWMVELFNRHNDPLVNYSSVVDVKDVLMGDIPELMRASEQNKPSPAGPFSFEELCPKIDGIKKGVDTSFIGWTNSMEPWGDYGDICIKYPYEKFKSEGNKLRLGQICIYTYFGTRIIHRLVATTADGKFIFKGDNNKLADPPVDESQIKDVVIGIIYTNNKVQSNQD